VESAACSVTRFRPGAAASERRVSRAVRLDSVGPARCGPTVIRTLVSEIRRRTRVSDPSGIDSQESGSTSKRRRTRQGIHERIRREGPVRAAFFSACLAWKNSLLSINPRAERLSVADRSIDLIESRLSVRAANLERRQAYRFRCCFLFNC